MVAKTFFGFEEILATELKNLGAQKVQVGNRMVSFYGDIGFMYKANLCLRTALKILKPITSKKIHNEKDLYDFIQSIRWEDYLDPNDTFAIYATVNSTVFNHSRFVSLKAKDAIVDKFRKETGTRPNVDTDYPDLTINIHIQETLCTVSLDSSGGSLHQRGYRKITNIAPINEVLAAGLLLLSGWRGQCDFLDPMCGSGTIAIEATMIACNIPANLNRKEFAFEKWLDWDMDLFEKIEEACLNKTKDFQYSIIGQDKAPSAVKKAKQNVENANLNDFVKIQEGNFFESIKEIDKPLHMVFNPPYGERLQLDVEAFYSQIGDTLKQSYPDTNAWFITSNLEGLKYVGLRPSRKIKVFNGKLESRLVKYEIYAGSKKAKYQS
ncbi:THUMP domain-containing class I SAM-dependent RNA methyltransferase [Aquimarina sp. 2201CG5-10]|uniref:THUMP domain-containing class I SAM-dependent RNA methyltransferase n=1 Tax=Aquimarina callyspongiae TaxID=3098150 RepID=UPI002AB50898|nr:THUMP domain-containing protein [Aquimarina sp. 2201CG5-10]MDY8138964.1 THUMP domain-containing protein [Aquimarina sp. 2201CG5-10]